MILVLQKPSEKDSTDPGIVVQLKAPHFVSWSITVFFICSTLLKIAWSSVRVLALSASWDRAKSWLHSRSAKILCQIPDLCFDFFVSHRKYALKPSLLHLLQSLRSAIIPHFETATGQTAYLSGRDEDHAYSFSAFRNCCLERYVLPVYRPRTSR